MLAEDFRCPFQTSAGGIAETGQEFEKWINKRHAKPPFDIKVVFVLTRRDRIFEDLIAGEGDIAAANLTITTDRSSIVGFANHDCKA